jgi:hypothetical protein
MTERELFEHLSTGADLVAPMLPGPASTVARFLGRAFALGADFIAADKDPIEQITRIRERSPMIAKVERGWEAKLRKKFGPGPPTLADIYAAEDEGD